MDENDAVRILRAALDPDIDWSTFKNQLRAISPVLYRKASRNNDVRYRFKRLRKLHNERLAREQFEMERDEYEDPF